MSKATKPKRVRIADTEIGGKGNHQGHLHLDIEYLDQLAPYSAKELLQHDGFGALGLARVERALAIHGLSLANGLPEPADTQKETCTHCGQVIPQTGLPKPPKLSVGPKKKRWDQIEKRPQIILRPYKETRRSWTDVRAIVHRVLVDDESRTAVTECRAAVFRDAQDPRSSTCVSLRWLHGKPVDEDAVTCLFCISGATITQ